MYENRLENECRAKKRFYYSFESTKLLINHLYYLLSFPHTIIPRSNNDFTRGKTRTRGESPLKIIFARLS